MSDRTSAFEHELAVLCEGREDRAAAFEYEEGLVLVVADGAGGTGHGASAAEAVIDGVRRLGWAPYSARWMDLLSRLDHSVGPGQTTAVVVAVGADRIAGASVGDSDAWWFGPTEQRLTVAQKRKPLLGDGDASPVGFHLDRRTPGTIVLASDGLWKYIRWEAVSASLGNRPSVSARQLVESVRYPSGAFPDDVSVIVCRLSS